MSLSSDVFRWLSYEEASARCQVANVTSVADFRAWLQQERPPGIPSNPNRVYTDEFKNGGWGRFLGTGRTASQNYAHLSYDEASALCQAVNITSKDEFKAWIKLEQPFGIPSNPNRVYTDEFENGGWGRFLGTGRVANQNYTYVSYDEASARCQDGNITSRDEFKAWIKREHPPGIPCNPHLVYPDFYARGGMMAFLGLPVITGTSKIERVLRYVLNNLMGTPETNQSLLRVKGGSGRTWHVDVQIHQANLIVEYDGSIYHHSIDKQNRDQRKSKDLRAAGWQVVRVRGQGQPYTLPLLHPLWDVAVNENDSFHGQINQVINHLKALAQQGHLKLSFRARCRLQAWDSKTLANVNFREVLLNYDTFVSYKEASARSQEAGATSKAKYHEWIKRERPLGIPSNPDRVYVNEFKNGGWGRFLGTERVAPQNYVHVSYDEASARCQAANITSITEFRVWFQQERPPGIPSNPDRTYFNEFKNGGWGQFLGTGRVRQISFLSYEDSSALCQKAHIKSQTEFFAWIKSEHPPGIPSNPAKIYANEFAKGGFKRFLGMESYIPQNMPTRPLEIGVADGQASSFGLTLKAPTPPRRRPRP